MSSLPLPPFASLLRRYRLAVGLTQEELAERAHLSVKAIGALERGERRTPRRDTIELLAEALQLSQEERARLEAAARGRRVPVMPQPPKGASPLHLVRADEEQAPPEQPISTTPLAPASVTSPAESISPPASHAPGKRYAVLFSGKWFLGLLSALLALAVLAGALFLKGEPGGRVFAAPPQTLCLATDFPTRSLAASELSEGLTAEYAVNLAVKQNRNLGDAYRLRVINYDDVGTLALHDPLQGAQNVADVVQNQCIVGMVGPFNDDVAEAEMPIAANAGLVMISPATTNPGLTLRFYEGDSAVGFDSLHPPGKPINFFRNIANDAFQGQVAADFTWNLPPDGLGARSAYVVDDNSRYALDLFGGFTREYLAKGGTILGTAVMPPDDASQLAELATRIVATRPDMVFYTGTLESGGGFLKAQLTKAGYTGLFLGGNAIDDQLFIDQACDDVNNDMFAIVPLPDLSTFTLGSAAQFLRDYNDTSPSAYPGGMTLYPDGHIAFAYDAAMILITSIKHLIEAGQPVTRAAMLDQVQHIQYTGVTSRISFDSNGDITHGLFSIYAVQDGRWVYVKQITM